MVSKSLLLLPNKLKRDSISLKIFHSLKKIFIVLIFHNLLFNESSNILCIIWPHLLEKKYAHTQEKYWKKRTKHTLKETTAFSIKQGRKEQTNETWIQVMVASAAPMEGREEGLSFSLSSPEMGQQTLWPLTILKFPHWSTNQPNIFLLLL